MMQLAGLLICMGFVMFGSVYCDEVQQLYAVVVGAVFWGVAWAIIEKERRNGKCRTWKR